MKRAMRAPAAVALLAAAFLALPPAVAQTQCATASTGLTIAAATTTVVGRFQTAACPAACGSTCRCGTRAAACPWRHAHAPVPPRTHFSSPATAVSSAQTARISVRAARPGDSGRALFGAHAANILPWSPDFLNGPIRRARSVRQRQRVQRRASVCTRHSPLDNRFGAAVRQQQLARVLHVPKRRHHHRGARAAASAVAPDCEHPVLHSRHFDVACGAF